MNIGIDVSKALGRRDGIGNSIRSLVRALAFVDAENRYHLYGLFHAAPGEELAAALPDLPANFEFAAERGPTTGEVDVFHCTTHSVPVGFSGSLVFTVHDLTFTSHPESHTLENRLHCARGLARALCRGAKLVAVSHATAAEIERRLAIPASAVATIHWGVDPRFKPLTDTEMRDVRQRLDLPPRYLLNLGTLEPRKNVRGLLRAYAALAPELRQACPLVIAGGEGWLAAIPPEERLGEARFLGYVDDEDLPDLVASAEALVYPSFAEGFGLPILEAMACGTPVLTSDLSAPREVAGDAALLVDPRDTAALSAAMMRLLTDAGLRQDLAARGRRRVLEFSWERCAREMVAVYAGAAAR